MYKPFKTSEPSVSLMGRAEEALVASLYGDELPCVDADTASAMVRAALRDRMQSWEDSANTKVSRAQAVLKGSRLQDKVVAALRFPALRESDLLALVVNSEIARSLAVLRSLLAHPAVSPAVVLKVVSTGWARTSDGRRSDLASWEYLWEKGGPYARAAVDLTTLLPSLNEDQLTEMVLEMGSLGDDGYEVFTTLWSDAGEEILRGRGGYDAYDSYGSSMDIRLAAMRKLVDQARLVGAYDEPRPVEDTSE